MIVVMIVTIGAITNAKLQSNCHHHQTNTQFFAGQMPFVSPNQQCQSTEGKIHLLYVFMLQHQSRRKSSTDYKSSIELSIDASSKSTTNLAASRRKLSTDSAATVELNVDVAASKSATNLAVSRTRPVSVPVHTLTVDHAARKLVSHYVLYVKILQSNMHS